MGGERGEDREGLTGFLGGGDPFSVRGGEGIIVSEITKESEVS